MDVSRLRPMRSALFALIGLSIALAPMHASAQDRQELQLWSAALGTFDVHPVPPALSFWLDAHARRGGAGNVVILRPGIGAAIFDWLSVWGGYAWVPTFDDATGATVHEHRLWEQAQVQYRWPFGLLLQGRVRLEQRFSDLGSDIGVRLRIFVRANWQPSADVPIGVAFWDELFLGMNDTDWGAPSGFDQNRMFIGPFLQMAPWARLEAGYLFTYLDRGAADLYAHVVAVNLFLGVKPPAPAPAGAEESAPSPGEPASR
jgi:hypothetical protein